MLTGAYIDSYRLMINGLDVTAKSRFSGTRDVPPSNSAILYNFPISTAGNYQAKVLFRRVDGSRYCYAWSFQVKRP
jgi:hypothetical protein